MLSLGFDQNPLDPGSLAPQSKRRDMPILLAYEKQKLRVFRAIWIGRKRPANSQKEDAHIRASHPGIPPAFAVNS